MIFQLTTATGDAAPRSQRTGGWTESYYQDADSISLVRGAFETLCTARARLLPAGARITGQRYQQVNPVGRSATGDRNFPGSSALEGDIPQMALHFRINGEGVVNARSVDLRGIPDDVVVKGEYRVIVAFQNSLQNFFVTLQGFQFRALDLSVPTYRIFGVDNTGLFVLEDAAPAIVPGSVIQVLRTLNEAKQQVGGRFLVLTKPTTTTGTLKNWTFGETRGGRMRINSYIYPVFERGDKNSALVIDKKIGRPSKGYRGRRSSRK